MEERRPLLDDEEETDFSPYARGKSRNVYDSQRLTGVNHNVTEEGDSLSGIRGANSSSLTDDKVVNVFVVAFDTKAGNLIEWCIPEDSDLEGVEFKAMASGSHTLLSDFVYFKHRNLYGLACFQNMKVESEIERGARMKSVGILAPSYTVLYRHMQFLETQVRQQLQINHLANGHQLETPGIYTQLEAFYQDKKGMLPASDSSLNLNSIPESPSTSSLDNTDLRVTHPTGCFSQFLKFFGEKIFILWKYILLQKRILFFSPPPIGEVCYRVYCACCLGNHSLGNRWNDRQVVPHFYVNVADIETLETELAYIACTTEKILETKTNLYDVYVDNQNIKTHIPVLRDLLRVSEGDMEKYRKLQNMRSELRVGYVDNEESYEEEEMFTMFFQEQNDRLFHTLLDISMSQDRTLTSEHMRSMGLDPVTDRAFLMELVEIYGIDVVLMVDNPCCPR